MKLLRQECYISHQKKFINYLVNQLAAHRFLKISCQLEKRAKISSAYLLLKAIELELHSYLSAVDVRLVLITDFIHYKFGILFSLLSMSPPVLLKKCTA